MISTVPEVQAIMKETLQQGKILPRYPVKLENYQFEDFKIRSYEGDIIYYNTYTACPHNALDKDAKPCIDCIMKSKELCAKMKKKLERIFCN